MYLEGNNRKGYTIFKSVFLPSTILRRIQTDLTLHRNLGEIVPRKRGSHLKGEPILVLYCPNKRAKSL
jgi:hypothetical protein